MQKIAAGPAEKFFRGKNHEENTKDQNLRRAPRRHEKRKKGREKNRLAFLKIFFFMEKFRGQKFERDRAHQADQKKAQDLRVPGKTSRHKNGDQRGQLPPVPPGQRTPGMDIGRQSCLAREYRVSHGPPPGSIEHALNGSIPASAVERGKHRRRPRIPCMPQHSILRQPQIPSAPKPA